ncbi:GCN5-related N-acetyltransferase [Corynebacterium kutscheri]|uniref:Mycothiol acetyltransferase n=1 Tax=Corynebacterium kutscheri TaxID=35755 RepID=A0AB38VPQ1_9CORY|nr:mycothiol synthase [Corynebacterium kutscheri]VEH04476.1 GCN5-related N-acetyltransferase [Corynebacterium kutscheri]VEH80325.1 GCN5-related N-acetyltransferase [Corynebacterium kutscheri]
MEIRSTHLYDFPDLAIQAHQLLEVVEDHDGTAAFSEQFIFGIDDAQRRHRYIIALDGPQLVGLAADDGATVELAVTPAYRRRKVGTQLVRSFMKPPSVWAHGNLFEAQRFADALNFIATRELLVMTIKNPALINASTFTLPKGYQVCDLVAAQMRCENIEDRWLEVNNEAFSWHPEQGGWDKDRLRRAQATDWFNPHDVLFLIDNRDTTQPRIAGFHWLKRHGKLAQAELGEVYVVGLADAYRGQKLGDPLVRMGLAHLLKAGAQEIILYVEADNTPAINAYKQLGFSVTEQHCLYTAADQTS